MLNEEEQNEIKSLRIKDKPKVGKDALINIYKFK
jgi:hypothetical protein